METKFTSVKSRFNRRFFTKTEVTTELDKKADKTTTFTKDEVNASLGLKVDKTRVLQFNTDISKTGLTNTINAGAGLNLLTLVAPTDITGDLQGISLTGGFLKFTTVNSPTELCNIIIRVRMVGTLSGSAGTPREFFVEIRRTDNTTVVLRDSIIKITDTTINQRASVIPTFYRTN